MPQRQCRGSSNLQLKRIQILKKYEGYIIQFMPSYCWAYFTIDTCICQKKLDLLLKEKNVLLLLTLLSLLNVIKNPTYLNFADDVKVLVPCVRLFLHSATIIYRYYF
jgi:hypothetical protein